MATLLGEKRISISVQQRLQQALCNWQQWQTPFQLENQPRVVKEFCHGLTNRTFLVAADKSQIVVRINSVDSLKFGIDRRREAEILCCLQATGLVPDIYYNDRYVMVSEFIEGNCLSEQSLQNAQIRDSLSKALNQIQSIKVAGEKPRNYFQYCRHYLDQVDEKALSNSEIQQIEAIALAVDNDDWEAVICHHDLVPENIIANDRGIFIVDWEYAALGHPRLDYLMLDKKAIPSSLLELKQAMDTLWLAVQQ
ncbi:MAG: phosphotransferase [Porticoccaceae bacterium]